LAGVAIGFSCVAFAHEPGVARLAPSGELDIAAAARLAEALSNVADDAVLVILDLSQLTFMDSSGLHAILTAHARLREAGGSLVLIPGPRAVQRIFELTRTDGMLEFLRAPDDDRQPWATHDANPV
jgi:anti-sigma B factor antagonist